MMMKPHSGLRIFSKHNRDIAVFVVLWCVGLGAGLWLLFDKLILEPPKNKEEWDVFLPASGLLLTATATIVQMLLTRSFARLGTAHLFLSEIASICRAIHSLGIVSSLVDFSPARYGDYSGQGDRRKENYIEVFCHNTTRLADLPTDTVRNVTAFYTFLKTSRDAALIMDSWSPEMPHEKMFEDVRRVMAQMHLCFDAGLRAVLELADDEQGVRDEIAMLEGMIRELEEGMDRRMSGSVQTAQMML